MGSASSKESNFYETAMGSDCIRPDDVIDFEHSACVAWIKHKGCACEHIVSAPTADACARLTSAVTEVTSAMTRPRKVKEAACLVRVKRFGLKPSTVVLKDASECKRLERAIAKHKRT